MLHKFPIFIKKVIKYSDKGRGGRPIITNQHREINKQIIIRSIIKLVFDEQ